MLKALKRLWTDEDAVTASEYGIIAAIIALALVGVIFAFRDAITRAFTEATDSLNRRQ